MIDSVSIPIVTLCLLVVCYTLAMCNFNITSIINWTYALRVHIILLLNSVNDVVPQSYRGPDVRFF